MSTTTKLQALKKKIDTIYNLIIEPSWINNKENAGAERMELNQRLTKIRGDPYYRHLDDEYKKKHEESRKLFNTKYPFPGTISFIQKD